MSKSLRLSALRVVIVAILISVSTAIAHADTKTWTGAVNYLWSTPGNWTGGVPAAGDRIAFSATGLNRTTTNDLATGTVFYDLTFLGSNYIINGNPLGLTDGITSGQAPATINVNLQVVGSQTMGGSYCCGPLNLAGNIDLGANVLTLSYQVNATGTIFGTGGLTLGDIITLSGPNTYTGPTTINQRAEIDGVQPSSVVSTAAYYNSTLSGTGQTGDVTLNSSASIQPGPGFGGSIGKLSTGSVTMNAGSYLFATLNGITPGVTHDQLNVAGTVTIDPAASLYTTLGFTPTLGQTILIVENDGADPVTGTFSGLPEGATINLNANELQISYVGGSGNDIELTVTAAAKTWTGAVNNLWSNAGNWLGGVPGPGDPLVFPASASNLSNKNDLPDMAPFKLILFTGGNYVISGNAFGLTDGITSNQGPNTINADLEVPGPQTMAGSYCCGALNLGGSIDLGANVLTLSYQVNVTGTILGTGGLTLGDIITLSGPNTYTGPTTINQRAEIDGVQPSSAVSTAAYYNATVSGTGKTGDVVLNSGASVQPGQGFGGSIGTLSTGSVTLNAGSYLFATLNGTVAGVSHDQLGVTGTVSIDGSASLYTTLGFTPTLGQTLVIVDNDNTDPVVGTFSGLPEGATINLNANQLQISYLGGTGNDIVLTVVAAAKTWTGAVSNLWSNPGNWLGGVPGPGDPIVFPAGASNLVNIDDLADGMLFKLILFTGGNYDISGGAFGLTEGIASNSAPNTIHNDLQVVGSQTMAGSYCCGPLNLGGEISLGANTLTLSYQVNVTGKITGTGGLAVGDIIVLSGPNTYTGPTMITQRGEIDGVQPASAISTAGYYNSTVSGTGRAGSIILSSGASIQPGQGFGGSIGKLSSGSVAFNAGSYLFATLNGSLPGVSYDQLSVTGTVSIDPAANLYTTLGFTPAKGQIFVLVSNDGTDPVVGTFSGLPQDATFNLGPYPFQISYIGKSGNDITVTSLSGDPFNFAPVAVDDAYSTQQDVALGVGAPGVLTNDSDPDLQPITVVLADTVTTAGGVVSVGANGDFAYTPPSGYTGTDTFTYIISDGTDATDLATATITVLPDPAGVETDLAALPKEFALLAPRPNPSQGAVEFGFALPEAGGIRAEVFDAAGRSVARLANDAAFAPGHHRLSWDGRDGSGAQVASGVYFVRVSSGSHSAIRKLIRVTQR
jgi:hypothetical protein